jgi:hypothetical protein
MQRAPACAAAPPRDFRGTCRAVPARRGEPMDVVFVVATIAFFAVSLAYVRGCDRM